MKKLYLGGVILLLLLVTIAYIWAQKTPPSAHIVSYTPQQLLGGWSRSLADPADPDCKNAKADDICTPYDSEEMNFESASDSNTYSSFLHHAPEFSDCTWDLARDTVTIFCKDTDAHDSFRILSLDTHTLTITRGGPTDTEVFQKIERLI